MTATSRELVYQTLNFENPVRAPRDLWALPAATDKHPVETRKIQKRFPADFQGIDSHLSRQPVTQGDRYAIGEYVDEWGCTFHNIQKGVIGEVKDPLVKDWAEDVAKIPIPRELLSIDSDAINRDCAATEKFTRAGTNPRPFEQLQFLRGSANLYMDLADPPREMLDFMKEMHAFYCDWLKTWCKTDVDGVSFMDDWGSQRSLLISPKMWREFFKPMYKDYVDIAHGSDKKIFFHSDGYILPIYPDLVEIGIDAVNSQLFCMGIENLKPFAGKITFWGEIDRQHLLPHGTPDEIAAAVRTVHENLWAEGGCIAQCEFGPGGNPANVMQVFETWDSIFKSD